MDKQIKTYVFCETDVELMMRILECFGDVDANFEFYEVDKSKFNDLFKRTAKVWFDSVKEDNGQYII